MPGMDTKMDGQVLSTVRSQNQPSSLPPRYCGPAIVVLLVIGLSAHRLAPANRRVGLAQRPYPQACVLHSQTPLQTIRVVPVRRARDTDRVLHDE